MLIIQSINWKMLIGEPFAYFSVFRIQCRRIFRQNFGEFHNNLNHRTSNTWMWFSHKNYLMLRHGFLHVVNYRCHKNLSPTLFIEISPLSLIIVLPPWNCFYPLITISWCDKTGMTHNLLAPKLHTNLTCDMTHRNDYRGRASEALNQALLGRQHLG